MADKHVAEAVRRDRDVGTRGQTQRRPQSIACLEGLDNRLMVIEPSIAVPGNTNEPRATAKSIQPLKNLGVPTEEMPPRVAAALATVGLPGFEERSPMGLSGGQQQRVAIARALVNRPQLILADEPTGALDTVTSDDIMRLLTELNAQGMTVVIVTHEADIAAWARRKLVFRDGLMVEDIAQSGGARV